MKRGYTDAELEEARDFLRRRLESEQSVKRAVEELLLAYVSELVFMYLYGSEDDSDYIIDVICAELIEDCETLALDEGRDDWKDAILKYMEGERFGKTLYERIKERVVTFCKEVYVVCMAGKLLGLTEDAIIISVSANMKHPYENELIKDVRKKIESGKLAGDLVDYEEPHYGSGKEISSMGALQTITGFAVADTWMWFEFEDAKSKGAVGYYVDRGSSYPCDECDSHTGVFFPIDDEANRPQYHLNCCCVIIYSYVDRLK